MSGAKPVSVTHPFVRQATPARTSQGAPDGSHLSPVGHTALNVIAQYTAGTSAQHGQDRRRELPEEHLHLHDVGREGRAARARARAPPRDSRVEVSVCSRVLVP